MPSPFRFPPRLLAIVSFALVVCAGCNSQLPGSAKPQVHNQGYLGSDEVLGLLTQSVTLSMRELIEMNHTARRGGAYCGAVGPDDDLFPFLDGLSAEQRLDLDMDLASSVFRGQLIDALKRLKFSREAPATPWGPSEELRIEWPVPASGDIKVWVNFENLKGRSPRRLARSSVHEGLHALFRDMLDELRFRAFLQFQQYANALGACIAARIQAPPAVVGSYEIDLNGLRLPLEIRSQNGAQFTGRIGVTATQERGALPVTGTVTRDSIAFEFRDSTIVHRFRGTWQETVPRYRFQGTYTHSLAGGTEWTVNGKEVVAHFADYEFASLAQRWLQLLPGLPGVVPSALRGGAQVSYLLAPSIPAQPRAGTVSVVYSFPELAQGGIVGLVAADRSDDAKFLTVNIAPGSDAYRLTIVRAFSSGMIVNKALPIELAGRATGGTLSVEVCREELLVHVNGEPVHRLALNDPAIRDIDFALPNRAGIVIGGSNAFASAYRVSDESRCR